MGEEAMLGDGDDGSNDVGRPPTPHDFGLLKSIRYEDAADGAPPVPVTSASAASSAAASPKTSPGSPAQMPMQGTSASSSPPPHPHAHAHAHAQHAQPAKEKRDSGIAPSISTAGGRPSNAESPSQPSAGVAREPTLPTIVVQDDEGAEPAERNNNNTKSPLFARKKSREAARTGGKPASALPPSGAIQRIRSFKGIQADIPSGTLALDDLDLKDLATDKIGFSQRGSLIFGGKKMNDLIATQQSGGGAYGGSNGIVQPITPARDESDVVSAGADNAQQREEPVEEAAVPKQGLVTGRRKPSVHMLQAALDGGRVLSAEEISFSMKVRSMYEHGEERVAEWEEQQKVNGMLSQESLASTVNGSPVPAEGSIDGVVVSKTRPPPNGHALLKPPEQDGQPSFGKDARELAGGIEDWDDVDGEDVDRYGFITPRRDTSRMSMASGSGEGLQRVATSLRLETDQPRRDRKLRRGPSNARSAQSMPPRPSRDGTLRKAPGSMHSFQSTISNPSRPPSLFSRDRKTLAEAADMLTLPPGLADIAEQEDTGKTASALKRREWAREEKWQKMARPVRDRANSKGGGMRFEFDTSDPKLINRTWKGIPDRWRATAWHSFVTASARRRGGGVSDAELMTQFHKLQLESCADDLQIDVDVPRTISMHIMFRRRYRGGQRLLFRVLHAISLYFPATGYVQGMASLAATLLCYYDEETAFVMLVRLWQLRGLQQLYQAGFEGLMAALADFEQHWLGGGDVARQLDELGISATAYGTRWYLTLFNMSVPFPAQLRVWDVFMLLGDAPAPSDGGSAAAPGGDFGGADLDVLHAASAALIDATREIILDSDFENAMKVLTSFVPVRDEDLLMRVARAEWKMRKKRGDGRG